MKKIYTIIAFVVLGFFSVAQTSPITFSDSEGWVVGGDNWNIKADNGTAVSIVEDPSGGDRGKSLKVEYKTGTEQWQNAQIKISEGKNLLSIGPNKTITMDVYTMHDDSDAFKGKYTGMLKLEQGTIDGAKEFSFPVSGTGWETITIDTSVDKNGAAVDALEAGLIVLFTAYGAGEEKKEDTRYYDNITFTDGSLLGADAAPSTAAPTPTHAAVNVLNLFSDNYEGSIDWTKNQIKADWSVGEAEAVDFDSNGNKMLKFKNLNYVGQYWSNGTTPKGSVNLSGYEFISFDIWVGQLDVDAIFAMTLLDSDQAGEKLVSTTISTNDTGWKTVTLNMSEWAGQDLTDIKGVKWEPTGTLKLAYIDNFYAWNNPSENTVLNVSVNTNANSNYPNVSNGDAIALNYSTDAGSSYKLSSPLADSDADGIWEGTLTLPKDTGAVQYKVAVVNADDGYSSATAQSGNTLASNADFSYTTGKNTVIADLFFLKRDSDADSFATLTSSAKVDVTVIIRGLHPDHTSGQYGVRAPGGGCYGVGDWTSNVDGVFTDTMSLQFYSTLEYDVGFHNATNGW